MIKGILFDKDGTLIEFEKTWHSIMSVFFKRLVNEHFFTQYQINRLKDIAGYKNEGFQKESIIQYLPTSEIVNCFAREIEFSKKGQKKWAYIFMEMIEESAIDDKVEVDLLPLVKEMLDYLSKKDYYLGIATADTEASMMHSLQRTEILHYFHYLGADKGILKGKPNPYMAEEFCRHMGIQKDELLIVGDSLTDLEFAKNAGAGFVGILNPYGAFKNKDNYKDHLLVATLDEMVMEMKL